MDLKPTIIIPDPDAVKKEIKEHKLSYPSSFFYANDAFNRKYKRAVDLQIGMTFHLAMVNDKCEGTIQSVEASYIKFRRSTGEYDILKYYMRGITWELYF